MIRNKIMSRSTASKIQNPNPFHTNLDLVCTCTKAGGLPRRTGTQKSNLHKPPSGRIT